MISVEHVSCTFLKGTPFAKTAVDDVTFSVADGEFIGIAGKSGSGKSTLLQLLGATLAADDGRICVNGLELSGKKRPAAATAAVVTMAYQNPEQQFFAETVKEELAFGARNIGKSETEINAALGEILTLTGLDRSYLSRSPFQLSGGEMRRVALASIFLMDTAVILLDEPTSGLDPVGKRQIGAIVKAMAEKGKTILWVGHDLKEMAALTDRLLVMADGKLLFDDAPQTILGDGSLRKTAGLFTEDFDIGSVLREKYGITAAAAEYQKLMHFFMGEGDGV